MKDKKETPWPTPEEVKKYYESRAYRFRELRELKRRLGYKND